MTARTADGGRSYDAAAGPLVRPYAIPESAAPGGAACTAEPDGTGFDLAAQVRVVPGVGADPCPGAEHAALLYLCRDADLSLADLAAGAGLPTGAVRVLVADLVRSGRVEVFPPTAAVGLRGTNVISEVVDGLRAL